MTSPNAGKITLGVDLDSDQLRRKLEGELTKSLADKVIPEIQKLNESVAKTRESIDSINSAPLEEISKYSRLAKLDQDKLNVALGQAQKTQKEYNDALAKEQDLKRELANAGRNLRRWRADERRDLETLGKVSDRVNSKISEWSSQQEVLQNDLAAATQRRSDLEARLANRRISIAKSVVSTYEDEARAAQRAADSIINDARRVARQEATDEKRRMRRAERERSKADRDRSDRLKSPLVGLGQIGRSLSGLSLGVSPGAFATMAAAALVLAGALASASKALWSLPAGLTAVGVGFAAIKVGMMGFSDTIGALIDGDLEQFAELINKLSPSAQQAALAIQQLGPQFSGLKSAVQEALFNDVAQMISAATQAYLPVVQNLLVEVAGSLNRLFGNAVRQLLTPESAQSINVIFTNIVKAFRALEPAAAPFTKAILSLLEATSGLLPDFFSWLTKLTVQFSDFIEKNKDNGKLVEWIKEGVATLGDLVRLFVGVGRALAALAPLAELVFPKIVTVLESITYILQKVPYLVEAALGTYLVLKLTKGIKALGGLKDLLGWIGGGFTKVKDLAVKAAGGIAAAFTGVNTGVLASTLTMLTRIGMVLGPIVTFLGGSWLGTNLAKMMDGQDLGWLDRLRMAGTNLTGGPIPADILAKLTPEAQAALGAQNQNRSGPNAPGSGRYTPPEPSKPASDAGLPASLQELLLGTSQPLSQGNPLPVQEVDPLDPAKILPSPDPLGGSTPAPIPGTVTAAPSPLVPAPIPGTITSGTDPNFVDPALRDLLGAFSADLSGLPPDGSFGPDPNLPVPPAPALGADGNPLSEAERRKQIRDSIDPNKFAVDPYAPIGSITNQPGWPGQTPLQVSIPGGIPGMSMPGILGGVTPSIPSSLSGLPDAMGANTQIDVLKAIAEQAPFNLNVTSGLRPVGSTTPGSYHDSGQAGDFSNSSGPTMQMRAFAEWLSANFRPFISELIYSDDSGWAGNLLNGMPHQYDQKTLSDHRNHVHVAIKDEVASQFMAALQGVPRSLKDNLYATNGPLQFDPATGKQMFNQVDQQAVLAAQLQLQRTSSDLRDARYEEAVVLEERKQGLADEMDVIKARERVVELEGKLQLDQLDLLEAQQGKFKNARGGMDLDSLPYGHPMKILGGILTGMGASTDEVAALFGGGVGIFSGTPLPGPMGFGGTPTAPSTDLSQLAQERNPMFFPQALGVDVPDFTRAGGGPGAQNIMANQGPPSDALGRVYSDTAALVDRTFTNLDVTQKARHDQVMAVLNEVKDRLSDEVLKPVVTEGITAGINGLKDSVTASIGSSLGQAAGPPIAAAVEQAIPPAQPGGAQPPGLPLPLPVPVRDEGGLWPTGTMGINLSGSNERVLSPAQTRLFDSGLLGGWNLQPLQQQFATVEGINVDRTLGADLLGVSQVPILGFLLNLLISILLKVINVEVEARDTLDEISKDFRDFRGNFEAVDAAGRLRSDTSGLMDRTSSSERAAADERIRILKMVLEGLVKFIVEKIIVPITKAVANSLISVASQLVSGAITGGMTAALPAGGSIIGGAIGNVVSGLITSAGSTAVDITAEVATLAVEAVTDVGLEALGQVLFSAFPDIMESLFGGGLLAAIFDPITQVLNGLLGSVTMVFTSLFGGLATLLPFDEGGVAVGTGMMPKATLAPERVLSPRQTVLFDKMVAALEAGTPGASNRTTTIHAPFTVTGNESGGRLVHDRLLSLMS